MDNIRGFIYINNERNKLVHSNYASYSLEAVYSEIWEKFLAANLTESESRRLAG